MKNKLLLLIAATVIMLNSSTVFAFTENQNEVMTGARIKSIARQLTPGERGLIDENGQSFVGFFTSEIGFEDTIEGIPDERTYVAHWAKSPHSSVGEWQVTDEISSHPSPYFTLIIAPTAAGGY